jgi:uncharacterized protein YheU (UPF0270 family)
MTRSTHPRGDIRALQHGSSRAQHHAADVTSDSAGPVYYATGASWRPTRVWIVAMANMEGAAPEPVVVPYTELAVDVLHAVVESYVLREGTDYGEREFSLADKVAHVLGQLKRGEAQIVFDPETESVGIVMK